MAVPCIYLNVPENNFPSRKSERGSRRTPSPSVETQRKMDGGGRRTPSPFLDVNRNIERTTSRSPSPFVDPNQKISHPGFSIKTSHVNKVSSSQSTKTNKKPQIVFEKQNSTVDANQNNEGPCVGKILITRPPSSMDHNRKNKSITSDPNRLSPTLNFVSKNKSSVQNIAEQRKSPVPTIDSKKSGLRRNSIIGTYQLNLLAPIEKKNPNSSLFVESNKSVHVAHPRRHSESSITPMNEPTVLSPHLLKVPSVPNMKSSNNKQNLFEDSKILSSEELRSNIKGKKFLQENLNSSINTAKSTLFTPSNKTVIKINQSQNCDLHINQQNRQSNTQYMNSTNMLSVEQARRKSNPSMKCEQNERIPQSNGSTNDVDKEAINFGTHILSKMLMGGLTVVVTLGSGEHISKGKRNYKKNLRAY